MDRRAGLQHGLHDEKTKLLDVSMALRLVHPACMYEYENKYVGEYLSRATTL